MTNDPLYDDCARRLNALENSIGEFREVVLSGSQERDKELGGLAGSISAERERASGYAFRIAALESVKPLGISTVLVTAAAVIGVITVVGGGYLTLLREIDVKDTQIMQIQVESSRRDMLYLDSRERELAVELRNADRDSWIRQDETRQKLAAVEARQEMMRDQLAFMGQQALARK